jgi:acetyl-CoA C-acetyltransferase
LGRRILPKAEDQAQVAACLRLLAGRRHQVMTAVALIAPDGKLRTRMALTRVSMLRLTDEQIATSASICDPLQLYDCCPASDGAAALVLVARHLVPEVRGVPVDVLATVQTRGSSRIGGHADLCSFDATVSAATRAYEMAGITPRDVDVVELHDCFSVAEIVDSEDLGLVPRGEGAIWAAEGRTAVGGQIPINPSGGLLAKGHPVGATGVGQLYEVVRQLRGTHPNQVRDAEIGMTHNLGGAGVACTVSLLRRPA